MTPLFPHAPSALVAVGDGGALSAAALLVSASGVARRLAGRGPGRLVLACDDRFHFAAGLLGAWSAGWQVILPASARSDALELLSRETGALLLHDRTVSGPGVDVRAWLEDGVGSPFRWPSTDRDLLAVATSGSTGPSQLVTKTLAQLVDEARAHQRLFTVRPESRFMVLAPPHHIYGLLFGILLPLASGAAFVRRTALHSEAIAEAVRLHGVTHVVGVPAHLGVLSQAAALPPVERVFSSGAPLPAEVAGQLASMSWPVTEVFGSTETGGVAWRDRPGAAWQVLPGVKVTVTGDGLLEVDGPYLHRDQSRPVRTGDLARLDSDGFTLLGRADGIVKAGGRRVSLREVEERVLAIAGVTDAAALGHDAGGARGTEVWLAVAGEVRAEPLRRELARWFEPVALPRRIRVVSALPREESGKLPRARLLEVFGPAASTWRLEPDAQVVEPDEHGPRLAELHFSVPRNLGWFEGHFDGHPVLAGVVQLHELVLRHAVRLWPGLGQLRRLKRLKFRRTIGPGTRLRLRLRYEPAARRLDFDLASEQVPYASGTLEFGAPSPPAVLGPGGP